MAALLSLFFYKKFLYSWNFIKKNGYIYNKYARLNLKSDKSATPPSGSEFSLLLIVRVKYIFNNDKK